jgi:CRP-like cAMP-binding protein
MRKALYLFGVLDDRDVEWMVSAGRVRRVAAGEVLISRGLGIDAVYVVLEGALVVRSDGSSGVEIARLQAGEVVGEMSFVDSRPPSVTVAAQESARVLQIPHAELRRRLGDTGFAARFYHALALFLADRLRATTASLGYGRRQPEERDDAGAPVELDALVLERVSVAGVRFEHMLRRLADR